MRAARYRAARTASRALTTLEEGESVLRIRLPHGRAPIAPYLIDPAARALRDGRLVAFPTETVYGLGANALDPQAVARIFAAKRRPANNPLIVHVHSVAAAQGVVSAWPEAASKLAEALWPGPLTLVLPRREDRIHDVITASLPHVGVRIPAHPAALALITAADLPVCAPSANLYTRLSPSHADHVARALADDLDVLLDAGPCDVGIESTVLSLVEPDRPVLLRPGMITAPQIAQILGVPVAAPRDLEGPEDRPAIAPGLAKKHYAPRAILQIVDRLEEVADWEAMGSCGVIAMMAHDTRDLPHDVRVIALPDEPHAYAAHLYRALHELDLWGADAIVVVSPPAQGAWEAIWDRLSRARS